ncbi:glucosamine-6-phosphate deaminase [Robertkochia solimangrovi]|uniref:glucosamine-6-phosphate deaminase n=1 Tax=Robertkochia solimangrovi TaxID=2213046 RepID=UPI0011800C97|nr:glucosamine-6-phosphate deaminase [Robertkochia solimangrovi]TRZ44436.1 glucosamine-6-phosphate deaminase [Robertkochia solimangrovi]
MIAEEQLCNLTDISYKEAGIYENTRFEKIHNVVYDDSDNASAIVAREIGDLIRSKQARNETCVLGLATGSSPIKVYEELIRLHKEEGLSFKNVVTFNLDEYYPMTKQNAQSYYYFMHEYLFNHIDIPEKNINIPKGDLDPDDILDFCVNYEKKIKSFGGLDFQLLGIGRTGHIGFNEPGSHYNSRTRLITLDHLTRSDASTAFLGLENVPKKAITMGIRTVMDAKRVVLLAWGQNKAEIVKEAVEGEISSKVPATYLQEHHNTTFVMDSGAASELTRIKTPWLVGPCEWTSELTRKSVVWLCNHTGKSILRLTDKDYNDNGMESLLTLEGSSYDLNIKMFNVLQHTITGWPGGKPDSDDTKRPERSNPAKKRVIIFSPHPDDDVISMGGTFDRLVEQGHEVHIAYQTSGNIAVSNHEAMKFAEVAAALDPEDQLYKKIIHHIRNNEEFNIDAPEVRQLKGLIRQKESLGATRYVGIPDSQAHFLNLPFYETGAIKKRPLSDDDVAIMCDVIREIKPHQIYAAGDLADPHGTHKVCLDALFKALEILKHEDFMKDCWVWLYRGAWHEWDMHEIEMAVPMSPDQVLRKRRAIFFHQSQKDGVMFQGDDSREFWVRAEERNKETASRYHKLGLADYAAIEAFKRYFY